MQMYTHIHTHTHARTHKHTHTNTHTQMYTHMRALRARRTNAQNINTHRPHHQASTYTHTQACCVYVVCDWLGNPSEQGTKAAGHGDSMGAIFIYSCDDIRSFSSQAVEVGPSRVSPANTSRQHQELLGGNSPLAGPRQLTDVSA